jgi:hypothetical protein
LTSTGKYQASEEGLCSVMMMMMMMMMTTTTTTTKRALYSYQYGQVEFMLQIRYVPRSVLRPKVRYMDNLHGILSSSRKLL